MTTTASEVFAALRAHGIEVGLADGAWCIRASRESVPRELVAAIDQCTGATFRWEADVPSASLPNGHGTETPRPAPPPSPRGDGTETPAGPCPDGGDPPAGAPASADSDPWTALLGTAETAALRGVAPAKILAELARAGLWVEASDEVLYLHGDPNAVSLRLLASIEERWEEFRDWLKRPAGPEDMALFDFAPTAFGASTDDEGAPVAGPAGRFSDPLTREELDDLHNPESFARGVRAIDQWFAAIERDERESARAPGPSPADEHERDRGADQGELW